MNSNLPFDGHIDLRICCVGYDGYQYVRDMPRVTPCVRLGAHSGRMSGVRAELAVPWLLPDVVNAAQYLPFCQAACTSENGPKTRDSPHQRESLNVILTHHPL